MNPFLYLINPFSLTINRISLTIHPPRRALHPVGRRMIRDQPAPVAVKVRWQRVQRLPDPNQ